MKIPETGSAESGVIVRQSLFSLLLPIVAANGHPVCYGQIKIRKGSHLGTMNCAKLTTRGEGTPCVLVSVQHLGNAELASDVRAAIEHALADCPGDWHVSVVGSQANDGWELKVEGPNLFERTYVLEGTAGEHRPEVIRVVLVQMLPKDTVTA